MRHVSYSAFREHLAKYMDEVCDSRAALHVTRQNARTVVLLSEDEYGACWRRCTFCAARPTPSGCFTPSARPMPES
jgi:hypothetical protein